MAELGGYRVDMIKMYFMYVCIYVCNFKKEQAFESELGFSFGVMCNFALCFSLFIQCLKIWYRLELGVFTVIFYLYSKPQEYCIPQYS